MSDFAYVDRLAEERKRSWSRAQEILNRALDEKRDPSPEERVELDRIETAMTESKAEAERWSRMASVVESADSLRFGLAPRIEAARGGRRDATDAEMLMELYKGERRSFESASSFAGAAGFQTRALQSAGGTAIATTFYDAVTVYERTLVPVLNVATVLNTSSGNPITLPRLTADPAHGGTVTAEAAGINELDPTISSVTLNAFKYAIVTLWSRELDQDEIIGLEDLIARASARELSIDIGAHLTTGTATTQPNGVVTAATNGGTALGTASGSATDTFVSPADLVTLYYTLAAPYRSVGTWMMSTTMAAKARSFRDSNKNFIWEPGNLRGEGGLDRFLGRPVYENPAMAAVASATKSVLFGDFSRYFIRRLPLRVEVSDEYKFSNDQRAIKVVERIDGNLVDTTALAYLVSANT